MEIQIIFILKLQETEKDTQNAEENDESSLGGVQISVTCATPRVEDAEKEFLPQESQDRESPPEPEPEVVQQPQPQQQSHPPQQMSGVDVLSDTILEEDEDEEDEPMTSPPKIAPPPLPPAQTETDHFSADPNAFEANFEDAFEANFDNAFGNNSEVPKQVVGGRASIPDELEPQQLAQLQSLKESNA